MIHRYMCENETGSNMYTLYKVIEECPYDTFPAMMEDRGNEELYVSNQNDLNKENKTGLD